MTLHDHPAAEPLQIRRVSAAYGTRRILHDVDLPALCPHTITVFAGPNGAGKSTLLKAVAGTTKASGDIRLGSRDLLSLSARDRASLVGFMPQSTPAVTRLTVLETVMASLRLFGTALSRAERRDKACATLERLGLLSFAASPLNELSGGQRQLAVLAQSLVRDPKILLLDEPTSALDLRHQVEVMTVLHAIARDDGCIVVLVLHDLALAAKWADRFVVLQDGRVAASGLTPEVLTPDVVRVIYGVEAEIRWTGTRGPQINILGLACANRTAD